MKFLIVLRIIHFLIMILLTDKKKIIQEENKCNAAKDPAAFQLR